jgi:hypothetical protein
MTVRVQFYLSQLINQPTFHVFLFNIISKVPALLNHKYSLPRPWESVTVPYHDPTKFSPHPQSPFLYGQFNYVSMSRSPKGSLSFKILLVKLMWISVYSIYSVYSIIQNILNWIQSYWACFGLYNIHHRQNPFKSILTECREALPKFITFFKRNLNFRFIYCWPWSSSFIS